MTAAEGLERQRGSFRGYAVLWDDSLQVCCVRVGCPAVLTMQDPERLDVVARIAGWRVVPATDPVTVYACGEHAR